MKNCFILILFIISTLVLKSQKLELYRLRDLEISFVSLSDIYPLSDDPDSLAIPDLKYLEKEKLQWFKLNSKYRKRFFSKTNISETDKVFIYDYSTDVLLSFSVKELNVVAYLNLYMTPDDCFPDPYKHYRACDQSDYMIGFEINKNSLSGLGELYRNVLVYVGKENPFIQGQIKPVVWKKIDSSDFPSTKADVKIDSVYFVTGRGNTYLYESDNLRFFIQDLFSNNESYIRGRHLLVVDIKNDKVVIEQVYQNSEGAMITPLNFGIEGLDNEYDSDSQEQWTGKLFKNKPPVVFGFEWVSFGCPYITLLNTKKEYIDINCDNRH